MSLDLALPVLVVDDHALVAPLLGATLRALGVQTIEFAVDGQHALNKLEHTAFGLMIADWHMDGMGCLELLRRVRGNRATSLVPFIVTAAAGDRACEDRALSAGADAFLWKPFSPETL